MAARTGVGGWWAYVQQHRGGDSNRTIGTKVGITTSTVTRWQTAQPTIDSVRGFAQAYGRPMLEAFIAAGFLSAEEAGAAVTEIRQDLTDQQIDALILARLEKLHRLEQFLETFNNDDNNHGSRSR